MVHVQAALRLLNRHFFPRRLRLARRVLRLSRASVGDLQLAQVSEVIRRLRPVREVTAARSLQVMPARPLNDCGSACASERLQALGRRTLLAAVLLLLLPRRPLLLLLLLLLVQLLRLLLLAVRRLGRSGSRCVSEKPRRCR